MENKAVFFDLDGTIRKTKSGKVCPNHPDDQVVMEGRYEKIWELKNKGYKIVGVTNQGGIGLGYMTEAKCKDILKDLDKKLDGAFDKILYAPARPDANHPMTKPNPGMIHAAAKDLNINLKKSIMVGDMDTDKKAAENAGVKFKWSHEFF